MRGVSPQNSNIDDPVRKAAETASLYKTGDFFHKLIITDGNRKLITDEDGISYVGVLREKRNDELRNLGIKTVGLGEE